MFGLPATDNTTCWGSCSEPIWDIASEMLLLHISAAMAIISHSRSVTGLQFAAKAFGTLALDSRACLNSHMKTALRVCLAIAVGTFVGCV